MTRAENNAGRIRPVKGALLLLLLAVVLLVALALRTTGAIDPAAAAGDPVIAAAGDIACDPANANWNNGNGNSNACRQLATSNLLLGGGYSAVLPLGDNQYECGSLWAYQNSYDLSWGRVKSITRPSPGNHDYLTHGGTDCTTANAGAAGYYSYFGTAAGTVAPGKGYYSYDIGSWHLISLNSNCSDAGGCGTSSPQGQWLAADLAAHPGQCTLAYWHIPLFSSGGRASANSQTFWNLLYAAHADVVLNGHDHIYERFAPQDAQGRADAINGIREFIAGTGGNNHTSIATVAANSVVRNTNTFGILALTLHPGSYDWQFIPDTGSGSFSDSGTGTCHNASTDHTAPSIPGNLTATKNGTTEIDLSWSASSDDTAVAGYRIYRGGTLAGTVTGTGTTYADTGLVPGTTYSYTVSAFDGANNESSQSSPASATTDPDTSPPTMPTGLTAAAASDGEVDLSWKKSTDDSGIDHYAIFRDGTQIDTTAKTTYADTTVAPSTTYDYTVQAFDVASNPSTMSADASATTPAAPTTLTFTPVADTWVQDTAPTTNYGSQAAVGLDNSPVKHILLKFDVSGLLGRPVQNATLRLYCVDPSNVGGEFHLVPDSSWTESGVTWNTAPAADAGVLGTLGSVTTGNWYELDVTSAITGDGLVSIEGVSTSANGADYSSKEGTAGLEPQLVITTTPVGGDTSPPTSPGSLAANGTSASTIDLTWTASTDDVGVARYDILRDGAKVGSTTGLGFQDTGLAPSSSHDYSVTAFDAAGNASQPALATASTLADTTPPGLPTGVTATPAGPTEIDLSWTAATDDVGVDHYEVFRDGTSIGTTTATAFNDTGLAGAGTTATYTVDAYDAAGNDSGPSDPATATTPVPPKTLTFTPVADTWVQQSSPTTNYGSRTTVGVDGSPIKEMLLKFDVAGLYGRAVQSATLRLYCVDSSNIGGEFHVVPDSSWTESGVTWNTAPAADPAVLGTLASVRSGNWYELDVTPAVTADGLVTLEAVSTSANGAGYTSKEGTASFEPQLVVTFAPDGGDTSPPTAPGNLAASGTSASTIDLSWTAATDDVGVNHYNILRDGTKIGSTAGLTFQDTGLAPSSSHGYSVIAYDGAGNASPPATASGSTLADTTPPGLPTGLTATPAGPTEIDLSWTAATDDVGVDHYQVLRDGTSIGTTTATAFNDTGLTAGTTATYTVKAFDAAGNDSGPSDPATATTPTSGTVGFFDGFETGDLSQWTKNVGVTTATDAVYDGAFAARVTSIGAQTYADAPLAGSYTTATYSVWIDVLSQGANNVNLFKVRSDTNGAIVGLYLTPTGHLALRNDASSSSTSSTTVVGTGWHRLVLKVVIGGAGGSSTTVQLDGAAVPDLSTTASLGTAPAGYVEIGERSSGRSYDVAFDDVQVTAP